MDLSGVAPEIQAAIQAGTITSVDQLQAVADIFQQLSASANPVAEQLRQIDIQTEAWTRTLQEAGVSTTRVTEWQASQAQSIRDQITGTTKTQKQIFDEQSRQFNTWLEQEHAKAQAAYDTANAEHAAAEAEIVRLQALIASAQASGAAAQFLEKWTEQLAAAQQQLADSAAALAQAQGTLAGLPDPIAPGDFHAGGGGGGTRRSDMKQLRDLIDQMQFDRLTAGMSELDAGLAKLNRDYQEQLGKAHGNAELIAALTAEYAAQEEQLRRNVQLSAVDKFQQALGIGQDPFAQLRKQFDDARKAVEEAGFGADRAAKMLGRLDAALQHQIEVLSQQQFVAIGDGLVGILEKYYGGVEGFEQFRMQLEETRFQLEIANLRAQFEILRAQGSLSDAVLARMQEVFDFIDAHPIDWAAFVAPAAPAITRANRAAASINDTFAEMARRLATAKESITSFLLSLQTGAFGGRSSSEAFNAAKSQFGALLNQAKAGNIQAIEQFPEIAKQFLDIARQRYGSTAEYQKILAQVESSGIGLLGVNQVTQDNVVFDQRFFDAQQQQIEVDRQGHQEVASAIRAGFAQQSAEEERSRMDIVQALGDLKRSQDMLNQRLAAIEARRRTEKAA